MKTFESVFADFNSVAYKTVNSISDLTGTLKIIYILKYQIGTTYTSESLQGIPKNNLEQIYQRVRTEKRVLKTN